VTRTTGVAMLLESSIETSSPRTMPSPIDSPRSSCTARWPRCSLVRSSLVSRRPLKKCTDRVRSLRIGVKRLAAMVSSSRYGVGMRERSSAADRNVAQPFHELAEEVFFQLLRRDLAQLERERVGNARRRGQLAFHPARLARNRDRIDAAFVVAEDQRERHGVE